jgi:hypothetical protein
MRINRQRGLARCRCRSGRQRHQVGTPGDGPGLSIYVLVSEDGGRLGDRALRFVDLLASRARTSVGKRNAFATFPCGVCALPPLRIASRSSATAPPLVANWGESAAACCPSASPGLARRLPSHMSRRPPQAVRPPWLQTQFPTPPLLQLLRPWVELPPLPPAFKDTADTCQPSCWQ